MEFDRQDELDNARELFDRVNELKQNLTASIDRTRTTRNELNRIVANFDRLSGRINGLLDRANGTRTDQSDALSVYGRFDGDVNTEAGSENAASVGLGKVFSTGIAAQNLTRGIKEAEIANGKARCLNAASQLYDRFKEDMRTADWDKFVELCGMTVAEDKE